MGKDVSRVKVPFEPLLLVEKTLLKGRNPRNKIYGFDRVAPNKSGSAFDRWNHAFYIEILDHMSFTRRAFVTGAQRVHPRRYWHRRTRKSKQSERYRRQETSARSRPAWLPRPELRLRQNRVQRQVVAHGIVLQMAARALLVSGLLPAPEVAAARRKRNNKHCRNHGAHSARR
eukprot:1178406-Prorocentrum_minimum.AAC.2